MLRFLARHTVRRLAKNRFYTGINVFGLAIGFATCLLISAYVVHENGYDGFHENGSRLYRVNSDVKWNDMEGLAYSTPPPLAAALETRFPEIEAVTRIWVTQGTVVRSGDNVFNEDRVLAADPNFLKILTFPVVTGDVETALSAPNSVVLTERAAHKYFGDANPIGATMILGTDREFLGLPYSSRFTVTAVVQNPPTRSHIEFDILTSIESHPEVRFFHWSWVWRQLTTYALLREGADPTELERKLPAVVAELAPPAFSRIGFSFDELIAGGGRWDFVLQPMGRIYLGSDEIGNRLGPLNSPAQLLTFTWIGLIVLVLACINFVNLTTARSLDRAREVGLRKALGAQRQGLFWQFLLEALMMSGAAVLIAIGLSELLLPSFSALVGKTLVSWTTQSIAALPLLLGAGLLVGLLAGIYPAVALSSFHATDALRARISTRRGGKMRNGLVVVQFGLAIVLIISTIIIHRQMHFLRSTDVGYEREGVIVISNENDRLGGSAGVFVERAKQVPYVIGASHATGSPPGWGFEDYYRIEGKGDAQHALRSWMVDDNFVETLGIEIVEGRSFSREYGSESRSVVVNETAVAQFGWEAAVGRTISYSDQGEYTVVGVMRDFHSQSMYTPIQPFALFHRSSESYSIPDASFLVRVQPRDLAATVQQIRTVWLEISPDVPFEYSFLDENLDRAYGQDARAGTLLTLLAGLALFVASLGLLGLASYAAEKRTREIGIRKTLGASLPGIVGLLLRDLTKWVVVASLLAWPFAVWASDWWLARFAYQITPGLLPFLGGAAIAIFVAMATIGFRAVKSARANPVVALRSE